MKLLRWLRLWKWRAAWEFDLAARRDGPRPITVFLTAAVAWTFPGSYYRRLNKLIGTFPPFIITDSSLSGWRIYSLDLPVNNCRFQSTKFKFYNSEFNHIEFWNHEIIIDIYGLELHLFKN